jgi:hypothetical protein
MKASSTFAAAILLSANWAFGQTQSGVVENRAPNPAKAENVSPANITVFFIVAEFTESINAKKLKAGDKIKAQVTQDLLSHGKILIPVESKLVGHVTEAKSRTVDDSESRLGIVFDKIILKNHHEVSFQGVIQSLEAPAARRSKIDEPDQMLPPSVMGASQSGGMGPMGGTPGRGSSSSAGNNSGMISNIPTGAPIYVGSNPGSNPGDSAGGDSSHPHGGRSAAPPAAATPLGAGMPKGVYGIKGLALSPGTSGATPGPVITSSVRDVKLEYGTQVLLKATDPHASKP